MDTSRLRKETASEHAATEDAVPLMSPQLTLAQYGDTLARFYRIVRAWDAWAAAHVPDDLRPMLAERRHASLLADDLKSLGLPVPSENEIPHAAMAGPSAQASVSPGSPSTEATASPEAGNARAIFLGRMYVMEGSTLGGQLLARHVEQHLGLQPGLGNRYFHGYGEATGARWREFRSRLEALPQSAEDTVIASARTMFHLFRQAMQSNP